MRLQSFDLFRKVPRDLVLSTRLGGALSLLALALLGVLLVVELWDVGSSTTDTALVVDPFFDEEVNLNLAMVFPAIPCRFLQVEFVDSRQAAAIVVEARSSGTSDLADGVSYLANFKAKHKKVRAYNSKGLQMDGRASGDADEMTIDTFGTVVLGRAQYSLVMFHLPYCPYCKLNNPQDTQALV